MLFFIIIKVWQPHLISYLYSLLVSFLKFKCERFILDRIGHAWFDFCHK